MENSPPKRRFSQPHNSKERERKNLSLGPEVTKAQTLKSKNSIALHRMHSSMFQHEITSPSRPRHHSKSSYRVENGTVSTNRNHDQTLQEELRTPSQKQRESSHVRAPSIGKINEMVAQAKLSQNPRGHNSLTGCTESIQPGAIFFSYQTHRNIPSTSSSNGVSRLTGVSSSAATSRKGTGKLNARSGVKSDSSGKTTGNRKKSQKGALFACMGQESCKTSKKSPERRTIDEALLIERAFVVESLPQFWADKYQPASLNGFICHKQEAQLLKELVSVDVFPHTLLKGPSGCGKRALAMALLREIYGEECWNLSHNLRYFPIQERRPVKVTVPITSSSHHVELNVNLEPNAKYALMGLVKDISCIYTITPEDGNIKIKSDCKVIVLYGVDKAGQNIQHLIKWIIDCHSEICKLVLCCEDDADILEPVKILFKGIKVDAPTTHEIMEVLFQIAKNENIHLSKNFAANIAAKSNQNLRKAIMALEACKAFKYPFSVEQPIPVGWEDILIEIASQILADPSNSRLISINEKFQKLVEDFVHPRLILQKLVEELLKKIEDSLKRELYYWHAYYDKRLPPGAIALTKLAEFVAKFMSIYRKSSVGKQYV